MSTQNFDVVGMTCGHCASAVTEAELIAYAKERIGSVKAPKQVHVWPDLPRSTVGKVLKAEIREQLRSAAH